MKKTFKTIFTIIIWIILIYFSKYQLWYNNYEIRETHRNWEDIKGLGGTYGIIISFIVFFIIIPLIWKKTKNEKLIDYGLKQESDDLFEAYQLNLITKNEYEKKIDKLLSEFKTKTEKKENEDYSKIEKDRLNISLEKLNELKNKGLINDEEFEEKKSKLFPKMIEVEELDNLVKSYGFDKIDTSIYEEKIFTPRIETLEYDKLLIILNKESGYIVEAVFQAYKELRKRLLTTANN